MARADPQLRASGIIWEDGGGAGEGGNVKEIMGQILARLQSMERVLRTAERKNSAGGLYIEISDASVISWCELLREIIAAIELEEKHEQA